MSFKNTIKLVVISAMMGGATTAFAAGDEISFFYGAGLSGIMIDEQVGGEDVFDPTAAASISVGIEEKGWALEYALGKSMDAGTFNTAIDYALTVSHASLGYRSIEKNKRYYLIKFGQSDIDIDYKGGSTASATVDGNVYSLGIGWRTGKAERFEIDYSLFSSSDIDNTHILTARYLWGGNASNEK